MRHNNKLSVKEFAVYFAILLVILGSFSFVNFRYETEISNTTHAILEDSSLSEQMRDNAKKRAETIRYEIEEAQKDQEWVEGLLAEELNRLERQKQDAMAQVDAKEAEIEKAKAEQERIDGLLVKELERLEQVRTDASETVHAKEAENQKEIERIQGLLSKELERLEVLRAEASAQVHDKEDEIEAMRAGEGIYLTPDEVQTLDVFLTTPEQASESDAEQLRRLLIETDILDKDSIATGVIDKEAFNESKNRAVGMVEAFVVEGVIKGAEATQNHKEVDENDPVPRLEEVVAFKEKDAVVTGVQSDDATTTQIATEKAVQAPIEASSKEYSNPELQEEDEFESTFNGWFKELVKLSMMLLLGGSLFIFASRWRL